MDFTKYTMTARLFSLPVKPRLQDTMPDQASTEKYLANLAKYNELMVAYEENRQVYYDEMARNDRCFRTDLFKEFGLENHPQRAYLFYLAGQSSDGSYEGAYNSFKKLLSVIRGFDFNERDER